MKACKFVLRRVSSRSSSKVSDIVLIEMPRSSLGFDLKFERERMTFTAPHLRFGNFSLRFFAARRNLYAPHERRRKRARHFRGQAHVFTGVSAGDFGYRAEFAQVARPFLPGDIEQATFFHVATAEIIAVKIRTFSAEGSFHAGIVGWLPKYAMSGRADSLPQPPAHNFRQSQIR